MNDLQLLKRLFLFSPKLHFYSISSLNLGKFRSALRHFPLFSLLSQRSIAHDSKYHALVTTSVITFGRHLPLQVHAVKIHLLAGGDRRANGRGTFQRRRSTTELHASRRRDDCEQRYGESESSCRCDCYDCLREKRD